jgi:hypothetical protein
MNTQALHGLQIYIVCLLLQHPKPVMQEATIKKPFFLVKGN